MPPCFTFSDVILFVSPSDLWRRDIFVSPIRFVEMVQKILRLLTHWLFLRCRSCPPPFILFRSLCSTRSWEQMVLAGSRSSRATRPSLRLATVLSSCPRSAGSRTLRDPRGTTSSLVVDLLQVGFCFFLFITGGKQDPLHHREKLGREENRCSVEQKTER